MLRLSLVEHNTAVNALRFVSKDGARFLDVPDQWMTSHGYEDWLTHRSTGKSIKYGPMQLDGGDGILESHSAAIFNNRTYVETDFGLKLVCKDTSKAIKLLTAVDGMIFGDEFFYSFAVCQCQNYKLSKGGLDVDVLTAIPAEILMNGEDNFQDVYSAEEIKNAVLTHLRKNGIVGSATVYPQNFRVLGIANKIPAGRVYAISLHVNDLTKDPVEKPLYFQTNRYRLPVNTRVYNNGMWFTLKDTTHGQLAENRCIQVHQGEALPFSFGPFGSSCTFVGERIACFNGKPILMQTSMPFIHASILLVELVQAHSLYKKILDNEIVKDVRIKGIRQGCTPFPSRIDDKKGHFVVEIPVNLSAAYFSMEQIRDALAEMLVGKTDTEMEITSVEVKKNHILFHINCAKAEE